MMPRTAFFVVWRLGEVGGMERHFCDLAIALKRQGTNVTVFIEQPLCVRNRYALALRQEDIAVMAPSRTTRMAMRFEHHWLYRRATSWRRESPATFALLRLLKRQSRLELPDVVHVHGCHLAQRSVLKWAKSLHIPAVYTEHVTIADWKEPYETSAPELFEDTDAIIACVSERSRESLARIIRSPISLATHIVPDVTAEAVVPPADGRLRLLSVGRLEACKGHHVLLQAAAILRNEGHSFRLVIAGDGEERVALENISRELRLESDVVFAGLVKQDSVPALWARADLGVLPSITEGLPISLLEALAAGRPMIATNVGGTAEVITDGVEGVLVPADDPDALASAIVRCMDRGMLVAMGRAARSRFERGPWSGRHAVEQTLELYDSARNLRRKAGESFLDRHRQECLTFVPPLTVAFYTYRIAAFGLMEQRITRQAIALSSHQIKVTLHVQCPVSPFNPFRRALQRGGVRVLGPTHIGWLGRRCLTRIMRGEGRAATVFDRKIAIDRAEAIHVHGWQLFSSWAKADRATSASTASHTRIIYEEHDTLRGPVDGPLIDVSSFDALIAPSPVGSVQMATALGGDHPPIFVIDSLAERQLAPGALAERTRRMKVFAVVGAEIRAQLCTTRNIVVTDELASANTVILTPSVDGYAAALIAAMASFKPIILTTLDRAGPIRHRVNGLISSDLTGEIECLRNDPLLAHQLTVAANRSYFSGGHDRLAIATQLTALYRPPSNVVANACR